MHVTISTTNFSGAIALIAMIWAGGMPLVKVLQNLVLNVQFWNLNFWQFWIDKLISEKTKM